MKINNETKIGILAVISLAILVLGFNYLKGKDVFSKANKLYTVFPSVSGLVVSNPVTVNGLQIGTVTDMVEKNANLDGIIVTINLDKQINIAKNSVAVISRDLLGSSSLIIMLGDSNQLAHNGDTITARPTAGLLDDLKTTLNPAISSVNSTVQSLDSLIKVMGGVIDPAMKNNLHQIIANLSVSSTSLEHLLNQETGTLAKTLVNMNQVTGNLAKQNDAINRTISNVETATSKLAAVNLDSTMNNLNRSITQLNGIVEKANSTQGSLGLLLNDKKLYDDMQNTTRSLNILLDDLRVHPKRYVNISVFGRKEKGNYLKQPLPDSTAQEKK